MNGISMTHSFVIGVAGGTGSGKTTIAHRMVEMVGDDKSICIAHDNYYNDQTDKPMEERVKTNYDHPDSLENELLIKHVHMLQAGKTIEQPRYDFVHHTRAVATQTVTSKRIVIVEGILLFASKELRELFDLKVFVDTDADVRFIRRLTRDIDDRGRSMESVVTQYLTTVRPMHLEFVEPSKRYADIIIPEGGHNSHALDLLSARLKEVAGV